MYKQSRSKDVFKSYNQLIADLSCHSNYLKAYSRTYALNIPKTTSSNSKKNSYKYQKKKMANIA